MKVISYSCSNIDSEDEIEGEDAYLNDIMFSHSADIDFDDDGWEEIIETGVSSKVAHQVMKLSLINRPNQPTTKRKKLTKARNSKKKNNSNSVPTGYDLNLWEDGDNPLEPLPAFDKTSGFMVDIPADANELYFLQLFVTEDIFENIIYHTILYADQFFKDNLEKINQKSRLLVVVVLIKVFISLTYYMSLIQKHDIKQYWSMDEMLATPFVRKLVSRDKYHNIQTFLHLCDNKAYPKKTDP